MMPTAPQGTGQKRQRQGALVVCSDRNWLWQSAFALQQAIDADPQGLLDYVYVTDFALQESPLAHLVDPRVKVIDASKSLGRIGYRQNAHVPAATFLRFHALDLLAETYRQVAYVDADTYLSWGSWTDLFDLPGHHRAVAAVAARPVWMNGRRWRYGRKYRQALSARMGDRYLNAGMLLINSDAYRSERISQRTLAFFDQNPALCGLGDQSALNAVLEGDWDELSFSWNWQVSSFNFPALAQCNPRVIHFTGPIKPWSDRNGFFRTALRPMVDFLRQRDAAAPLAELEASLAMPPSRSARAVRFRAAWLGDGEAKLARFDRYLGRRDFLDTRAGRPPLSDAPSGFGSVPTLPAATDMDRPIPVAAFDRSA